MNILNVREYIETFLKIRTKDGTLMPLRLNQPQDRMYQAVKSQWDAGKPVRIIVLKARQMGFSTLTEAIIFAITATRFYTDCMIVAHKDEATANLFRMSLRYYENLPEPMKPMRKASNAHELVFDKPAHYKGRPAGPGELHQVRHGRRQRCRPICHAPVPPPVRVRLLAGETSGRRWRVCPRRCRTSRGP